MMGAGCKLDERGSVSCNSKDFSLNRYVQAKYELQEASNSKGIKGSFPLLKRNELVAHVRALNTVFRHV
jgi:hypothetical protein